MEARRTEHEITLGSYLTWWGKYPEIEDENKLWSMHEIVAGWINFYAFRCECFHSDIEKEKNLDELFNFLNDFLDKLDQGRYESRFPEYRQYVWIAAEELRDKHSKKDGDVWKSAWTNNLARGSIEHESSTVPGCVGRFLIIVDEQEPQQKALKKRISKSAGELENGDDDVPTTTPMKRKIPDDETAKHRSNFENILQVSSH